ARGPEAQSPRRLTRPAASLVVGFGRVALGHHLGVKLEERLAEAPHQPTVHGAGRLLPRRTEGWPLCDAPGYPRLPPPPPHPARAAAVSGGLVLSGCPATTSVVT